MHRISKELAALAGQGNFRHIPLPHGSAGADFSSNDYLGIGVDTALQQKFFESLPENYPSLTSSASRLLAQDQEEYFRLETALEILYGNPVLLFNSGYHANTGLISALGDKNTIIVADKLVHASIIDGYKLSDAEMVRFRHNDINHLENILRSKAGNYERVIIVVESVYSMDGDSSPLEDIAALKSRYPQALLYVDEAHAFGVCGPRGLGLVADSPVSDTADVIVGTFGKAAASVGAFAVLSGKLKDYAINRARSFIFSTAIPPLNCAWTRYVVDRLPGMTERRATLQGLVRLFCENLDSDKVRIASPSHIIPVI
ncbi:MAG: aminotransferase class I/II-fold pyridoxal phosphate-dependent enzyme, partial [Paramuribaculum sp.]|nr:aminotransferase class I/II-fold pyridoxal phosphate-dependent enzyme [Paramuribaculum sp.]